MDLNSRTKTNHIGWIKRILLFNVMDSSPRLWYSEWVEFTNRPFSRAENWDTEIPNPPRSMTLDWSSVFILPYQTTREIKLQLFAYKTVYRLTPCNKYLRQVNIQRGRHLHIL